MIPMLVTVDAATSNVISKEEYGDSEQFRNQGNVMFHYYDDPPEEQSPYGFTSIPVEDFLPQVVQVWQEKWLWPDEKKGEQYIFHGSPNYDITWNGNGSDDYYLKFIIDDYTHAKVTLRVDFNPGDPFIL